MAFGVSPTSPDESRNDGSDTIDPSRGRTASRSGPAGPGTPSTDEIGEILSSSSALPEPDPMLSGASSWDHPAAPPAPIVGRSSRPPSRSRSGVGLDIVVEPVGHLTARASGGGVAADRVPTVDWSGVLLKSYASALTLAVVWILWTGKASPRQSPSAVHNREAPALRRRSVDPVTPPPVASVAPPVDDEASRTVSLGKSLVLGDLEITPLLVLRKSVRTTRDLGEEVLVRDHGGCLALTLRLKNLGGGDSIRPLDLDDLRDGEAFAIDAPPGPKIAMFVMAPSSEWTLDQPGFPTLEPGEVSDVVLVSEPGVRGRLAPSMTWRLRLRVRSDEPNLADVIVRFNRDDVHGE